VNDTIIRLPNGDFTTAQHLTEHYYKKGHLGEPNGLKLNDYMIIEDKVHQIHKVIVHRFMMGDVEDPDLYAAEPLLDWQHSEMGKWVMEKSVETPVWHRQHDQFNYGYQFAVEAFLKGADYSFWVLKWGNQVDRTATVRV
jgi:hypothetical protein